MGLVAGVAVAVEGEATGGAAVAAVAAFPGPVAGAAITGLGLGFKKLNIV
jgi:hypothetical protein